MINFNSKLDRAVQKLFTTDKVKIESSQDDGWKISTPFGYIDYRHRADDSVNEIWWVESSRRGHGSELVDLMQQHHPAQAIAWGVTSQSGSALMRKWHTAHPEIGCVEGAHDGQFDPFEHTDTQDDQLNN